MTPTDPLAEMKQDLFRQLRRIAQRYGGPGEAREETVMSFQRDPEVRNIWGTLRGLGVGDGIIESEAFPPANMRPRQFVYDGEEWEVTGTRGGARAATGRDPLPNRLVIRFRCISRPAQEELSANLGDLYLSELTDSQLRSAFEMAKQDSTPVDEMAEIIEFPSKAARDWASIKETSEPG